MSCGLCQSWVMRQGPPSGKDSSLWLYLLLYWIHVPLTGRLTKLSQDLAINLSLLVASARRQLSHLEIWLVTDLMARRGWARVPCKTHPHTRPLNEWAHSVGLMVQGGTGESKLRSPLLSPLICFLPPPIPSPSFPSHQFQGSKFFLPFPNSGIRNFPSSEFTVCLHYFSLTVIKQHNQGSLWKKALNLGLTLSES